MSNLSCGTHVAEPSANKDCRKLLNQFCRFLPKLKLPISADAKLPLTRLKTEVVKYDQVVLLQMGYDLQEGSFHLGQSNTFNELVHVYILCT